MLLSLLIDVWYAHTLISSERSTGAERHLSAGRMAVERGRGECCVSLKRSNMGGEKNGVHTAHTMFSVWMR